MRAAVAAASVRRGSGRAALLKELARRCCMQPIDGIRSGKNEVEARWDKESESYLLGASWRVPPACGMEGRPNAYSEHGKART